jgi:hypothetical protein
MVLGEYLVGLEKVKAIPWLGCSHGIMLYYVPSLNYQADLVIHWKIAQTSYIGLPQEFLGLAKILRCLI